LLTSTSRRPSRSRAKPTKASTLASHIERLVLDSGAFGTHLLGQRLEPVRAARADNDVGAQPREMARRRLTDPAGGAGDGDDLAG
jgi:hypothetical protein